MNITLDKQIKKLRKENNITQESLANHLGITVQAVSKWERAEGMPDIALLPAIASFFNVSVDDILGVGEIEREKRKTEYLNKQDELSYQGKAKERVSVMREAQKEFPNDYEISYHLMYALDSEDSHTNADEIISLAERIINESTDVTLRSGAIQMLAFAHYFEKKDAETAKKYAEMCGTYDTTVNEMKRLFLEGEDAVRYCQSNLLRLFDIVFLNVQNMIWKGGYLPEKVIAAYEFSSKCFELLYSDGNFGFYHCRMSECYMSIAEQYSLLNNKEQMLDYLEKAAEHAIKFDTLKDGMYTAFMVNKLEMHLKESSKNYEENDSALMLKDLEGASFSKYQNEERIIRIKEKLKQIAVFSKQ